MGDYSSYDQNNTSAGVEDNAIIAARKAKKYLLNQDLLTRMAKKREDERRRTRRYQINTELLEANGNPGQGSKVIDLSMNGARLELPFSPPFHESDGIEIQPAAISENFPGRGPSNLG